MFQIDQGNLIVMLRNIINLKGESMWWKVQNGETRCQGQRSKISRNDERVESHLFVFSWLLSWTIHWKFSLVVRSNQSGFQNPSQIHRHQKPTRRHPNQRKFHMWWVESFVVLVQYQPFQFYSLLCCNGEETSTRFRRRTSHSKIATNDEPYCKGAIERIILDFSKPGEEKLWKSKSLEYNCWERGAIRETWHRHRPNDSFRLLSSWAIHGKLLFSKLLKLGLWPCLVFSRVENWYWDVRAIGATRCHFLESDTRIPTWFLSRGNSSWWNRAIHYEWGNTSWKIGETRCWSSKRSKATTIRHWKWWNRIRIVRGIKIIRESGEWSGAKKTETNFKCYRRWRKTFYDLVNVHDCDNGISSIHGKELPVQLSIHREHNRSHTQTNVRHINKIGVWARWDLWIGNNWLGESFMDILFIDWWRKRHQSSTYEGLRLFGFCVVPWEDSRKPSFERCMETKIGMVEIFSELQKLWQNRRRANGIRVEHFPGFNTLQLSEEVRRLLLD